MEYGSYLGLFGAIASLWGTCIDNDFMGSQPL